MSRAPQLYLITDRRRSTLPLAEQVARSLDRLPSTGVAVQLREKELPTRELLRLATEVRAVCRPRGVPLLLNDRIDLALALGPEVGVHLGGASLPAFVARSLLGPGPLIGISTHSPEELAERAPGADFATFGPVYPTPSKAPYGAPVGLGELPRALEVGLPLLALGGVTPARVPELRGAGFGGIACIGAVFGASDPGAAALELLEAMG